MKMKTKRRKKKKYRSVKTNSKGLQTLKERGEQQSNVKKRRKEKKKKK